MHLSDGVCGLCARAIKIITAATKTGFSAKIVQKNPTLTIEVSDKKEGEKKSNVSTRRFSTKATLDQTAVQR